ncbi:hypothetical protein ACFV4N_11000 [Actinosynnema sp. NPDC059797]
MTWSTRPLAVASKLFQVVRAGSWLVSSEAGIRTPDRPCRSSSVRRCASTPRWVPAST